LPISICPSSVASSTTSRVFQEWAR
jgi:hypothetical protein